MQRNSIWNEYAQCNKCKKIVAEGKFSDSFFVPVCPKCGVDNDMEIVVARKAYKSKWYNPFTWFSFEWEIKE